MVKSVCERLQLARSEEEHKRKETTQKFSGFPRGAYGYMVEFHPLVSWYQLAQPEKTVFFS